MSKKSKKKLVPVLRFPDFNRADGWDKKPLNKISKVVMGSSPRSSEYNESGDGLPLLQGNADIKNGMSAPRIFTSQITKECEIGDILLSVRAPVGAVAKSNHNACIGRGLSAIRAHDNNCQEFIYQWLIQFEPNWRDISQGGTFDAVNSDDIKKLLVAIPKVEEQKKIADCLSSLDEVIDAHTKKHEALQSYKKGLMQNLFPAEGETVPALRFPEFEDSGEWDEVPLGRIANFASGGTPSKNNPDFWGGSVPWISASSMYETNLKNSDLCITQYAVDSGARIARKGSLLILVRGSMLFNRIPIGIAAVDLSFNQDVKALTLKDNIIAYFVLYQLMAFENRIPVDKTGIGAGKIELDELKRFSIFLSKEEEQQKIADCISSVDELITAQAQKIADLKAHKKGLMQQLFPAMDEVEA